MTEEAGAIGAVGVAGVVGLLLEILIGLGLGLEVGCDDDVEGLGEGAGVGCPMGAELAEVASDLMTWFMPPMLIELTRLLEEAGPPNFGNHTASWANPTLEVLLQIATPAVISLKRKSSIIMTKF